MSELFVSDQPPVEEVWDRPPLYLQHYLDEREGLIFSDRTVKPPGPVRSARVVERRDNLIILEFRDAPQRVSDRPGALRRWCRNGWDAAMLLLLIASAVACVAAFLR